MKFFTDPTQYTHKGSFYGIPVYLNLDDIDEPVIEGTNIVTDKMLVLMSHFHNTVIEYICQAWSAITGQEHEIGFPFWIKEELSHKQIEN